MQDKYYKLLKNTAIYTIGSFGSKVLTFLIVPLYTYVLTTAEYGKIDIFATANSLMLPFTTLLIQEALIRFLPTKEVKKETALAECMYVFFWGVILTLLCYPLYMWAFDFSGYMGIYILVMIVSSFTTIFGQYLRASGDSIAFALCGLIQTAVFLAFNVIFLIVFKIGMHGYFYSMLISQIVVAIFICSKIHFLHNLRFSNFNSVELKAMLRYSIPLIPNSLMWWIMNAGDKLIINHFLGDSANGIYSMALKIPSILSLLYGIFMQAWQLSAVEENNKKGQSEFYTKVFSMVSSIMFVLTAFIILLVKPFFLLILQGEFAISWKYVGLLSIANVINCFATFAGVVYTLDKKSIKAFYTTAIGAIVNIVMNIVLINNMKLFGVAIATILGYVFVLVFRMRDMHKEFNVAFSVKKIVVSTMLLFVQILISLKIDNLSVYFINSIILIVIICLNAKPLLIAVKSMVKKIKKN